MKTALFFLSCQSIDVLSNFFLFNGTDFIDVPSMESRLG